jgi:hypothetical protein
MQGRTTESEPLLEHIELAKDIVARKFHRQAAQNQNRSIQKEDRRQKNWAPVADLLVRPRIHVCACLPREKQHDQHGEKHHVAGETKEDEKADAVQQFAWAASFMPPIVVTTTASASGGAPVHRRLAADSWLFPFRFRWGVRKGSGHSRSSVKKSILRLLFGRMCKETGGFPS